MSATLDARLFCDYYGGAPLITIPGRTFGVCRLPLPLTLTPARTLILTSTLIAGEPLTARGRNPISPQLHPYP